MMEIVTNLLVGAIDTHIHTSPDVFPRSVNDIEAATQARDAGMQAIVLKNHFEPTASRAQVATKVVQGIKVFGGIVLNYEVGGLNPYAVRAAVGLGAKIVWMPTISAKSFLKHMTIPFFAKAVPEGMTGLSILGPDASILTEVRNILQMVAENKLILGTGHLSIPEQKILVDEARKAGVRRILVQHPQIDFLNYTVKDMQDIVEKGALLEHHAVVTYKEAVARPTPISKIVEAIRTIGAEHTVLATDGGFDKLPRPVQMLKEFVRELLESGIPEEEIRTMIQANPRRILDI